MRVFVTGATGFIGYHVVEALLARDHTVAALVGPDSSSTRLAPFTGRFDTVSGTLEDGALLQTAINRFEPEACIHLAWYAEPEKYLYEKKSLSSLTASISLFDTLIGWGCRHIIGAGTCFEYDTSFGYLREDTPVRPASLYGAAKLSCYLLGAQLASQAGIRFAWCRIFNPYGPRENPRRLIPGSIAALRQGIPFLASPGEQIRDYIHVTDVARAFVAVLENRAEGIYNISTANPVSVREALETVGRIMDRLDLIQVGALPYRAFDPAFICGNNERLKNLGWKPVYSLAQGLAQTIDATTCANSGKGDGI